MTHLEVIQKVWPDWKVTEKIGEGSFGQVFKAEKESYGIKQESAIKVVRIPGDEAELEKVRASFGLDDDELKDYFYPQLDKLKKEIELMMKLDDSHIVKIYDFEIKESLDSKIGWYMIIRMELLECLEQYVRNNDIRVEDVISIGEDILSCLETCKENNIIHRDIKPANLFRNDKGVYKLGDFGIAKDMSSSIGSLSFKGTENYMAPEVFMGKRYDSTIDIYALGIVLYKLLNKNRLPFMSQEKLTSASIEKAFQKRNTGEPLPKPVQASDALYEVIQMMSAFKPEDRFQTATVAKKVLTEYRRKAGEELKTVLDINNKGRNQANLRGQNEQSEKSIVKSELLMQTGLKAEATEQYLYTEIISDEEDTVIESDNSKIESTENPVRSQIFNETYNMKQSDEDLKNKTRSLYHEEEKSTEEEVEHPGIKNIINDEDIEVKKKKSKAPFIIGIGVACIVVLASLLFLVFGNNNDSKVAIEKQMYADDNVATEKQIYADDNVTIAKQIYADDNVFVIDKDRYKGEYIEHTTSFLGADGLVERTGIYIGETKSGEPDGYGAFYYRREGNNDFGKFTVDFMCIGSWEKGNLVGGKDKVKKRIFYNQEYSKEGNNYRLTEEYILEGDWGIGDFVGNPEGIYKNTFENMDTELKMKTEKRFEGTFEVKDSTYNYLNGDYYINNHLKFRGEFKDNDGYNGTLYDVDGKEESKVVNGEIVQ
jgi:hypothetical protein